MAGRRRRAPFDPRTERQLHGINYRRHPIIGLEPNSVSVSPGGSSVSFNALLQPDYRPENPQLLPRLPLPRMMGEHYVESRIPVNYRTRIGHDQPYEPGGRDPVWAEDVDIFLKYLGETNGIVDASKHTWYNFGQQHPEWGMIMSGFDYPTHHFVRREFAGNPWGAEEMVYPPENEGQPWDMRDKTLSAAPALSPFGSSTYRPPLHYHTNAPTAADMMAAQAAPPPAPVQAPPLQPTPVGPAAAGGGAEPAPPADDDDLAVVDDPAAIAAAQADVRAGRREFGDRYMTQARIQTAEMDRRRGRRGGLGTEGEHRLTAAQRRAIRKLAAKSGNAPIVLEDD